MFAAIFQPLANSGLSPIREGGATLMLILGLWCLSILGMEGEIYAHVNKENEAVADAVTSGVIYPGKHPSSIVMDG